jgi:hypothetical protein
MSNDINGIVININASDVVDRDEYVEKILPTLKKSDSSNIVIISSPSAIGKSSLVSKLLSNVNMLTFRIKTSPLNESTTINEWSYFDLLFRTIKNKFGDKEENSFFSYINSFKDKTNNGVILSYIIDKIFNMSNMFPIIPIVYLVATWYFKLGKFDVNTIIDDNSMESRRIKNQYIKYVFNHNHIIINIDNMQNIDEQSFKDLINLINETKEGCHKFLFEYTLSEKYPMNNCQVLSEKFSDTNIKSEIIPLKKLDKKYIVDAISRHMLIPINAWDFNIKLQKLYENNNSGNIREMLDFALRYEESASVNNENNEPTFVNIDLLEDYSKQVLAFIVNLNGRIRKSILEDICKKIKLSLNDILRDLEIKLMIEINKDIVVLSHASILDIWNKEKHIFSNYDNIAFYQLTEFYNSILINNILHDEIYDEAWLNLIQLYSKYEPRKIVELFSNIENDANIKISPQNAWLYIAQMISVIENKKDEKEEDLYFRFIKYCFENELYNEGYSIIEILSSVN